jgi:hypothetical protein
VTDEKKEAVRRGVTGAFTSADLLGSVVGSDRERAGRDCLPYDKRTTGHVGGRSTSPASGPTTPPADELTSGRAAEALRLAASPTVTVTFRLPRALNDWLDEYVHRSWPERVRKQELVAEALRLLFARRGRAGEPVVPTDLLPEGGP